MPLRVCAALGRGVRRLVLICGAIGALACAASAEEITLVLKGGGGFQITGELKAFDGRKYTIINPSFGKMEVDGGRFDCVSGNCPTEPMKASIAAASLFSPGRISAITVAGSSAIGNRLMPELVKAFAAKLKLQVTQINQPDPRDLVFSFANATGQEVAKITLNRQNSSAAFEALRAKAADIGMSSRPVSPNEIATLRAVGLGDMSAVGQEHVIALDGLLVLASPNNPAISMSLDDVAKVFSGQVTDWAQLGYAPGPITVHAPAADSGTWETFNDLVLKPRNLKLVDGARRTTDHAEQSDWVAADPLGIGVVGIAYQRSAKPLNIESGCGLITPPSTFSIKTEEYPLARRLFVYTPGQPQKPLTSSLLDFSLSSEAQPVVRQADFVDQAPELISFRDQGSRVAYALNAPQQDFDLNLMRTVLTDLKDADRLTYTFRFRTGAFALDAKSRQDVTNLSRMLVGGELKGKQVKLIGFADSGGSFQTNLTLSLSRARAVQAALIQAAGGKLEAARLVVKGYGELAPVACNDTPVGKAFNRRVEVWVNRDQ